MGVREGRWRTGGEARRRLTPGAGRDARPVPSPRGAEAVWLGPRQEADLTADQIIAHLRLERHPEGGWFRQTWVAEAGPGERPAGTAILFLLRSGERSHWHRVDADEIWHFHAGAPLVLSLSETDLGPASARVLGPDLLAGQSPQLVVPAGRWQAARSTGDWTLVGCTVSPGFRFEGFTLAPPGFDIPVRT